MSPLDANKAAHIAAVVPKTWAQRQKTVTLVTFASGVYSYSTIQAIFRPQDIIDPEIPNGAGGQPRLQADMYMICATSVSFTGVVMVADTGTATSGAVAAANKYEIIEVVPTGLIPGGTHLRVALRRFR